ncbi:MAG: ribonuclease HI family protein [Patescibacteria group bacterium]
MRLFLFTDGASRGNPGPAGAGIVLKDEKGAVLLESHQFLGRMTNNEAEYRALLFGLAKAAGLAAEKELVVLMDSELVVSQLKGVYRMKAPHLRELLLEARIREKPFGKVVYQLIPRAKNARADALANEALDKK